MFDRIKKLLQTFQNLSLKKIFSILIFGLICLIFIFMAPLSQKILGENILAYVGDEPVRSGEVRFVERSLKLQYAKHFKNNKEETLVQKQIRTQALQQLIEQYLIVQGSTDQGFFITDRALGGQLMSIPIFQQNGRFSQAKYRNFLTSQNLQDSRFETRMRRYYQTQKWISLFNKSLSASLLASRKESQKRAYKVNLKYAVLDIGKIQEELVKPFIKNRNLQKINQFLKQNKVSWKTTGEFPLFSPFGVPIAQNHQFINFVVHQLPHQGLISQWLLQGNRLYIINILSFRQNTFKSPQDKQFYKFLNQSQAKAQRLQRRWMGFQKSKFPIKTFQKKI